MTDALRTNAARWLRDHNPVAIYPMDTDELEGWLVKVETEAAEREATFWRGETGVSVRFRHDRMHGQVKFPCVACPSGFRRVADAKHSPATPKSPALQAELSADAGNGTA